MNSRDVHWVVDYIDRWLINNGPIGREDIQMHSYSLWAAEEVLNRVIDEASKLPDSMDDSETCSLKDVIGIFMDELESYMELATNEQVKYAFQTAYYEVMCMYIDIATQILEGEYPDEPNQPD